MKKNIVIGILIFIICILMISIIIVVNNKNKALIEKEFVLLKQDLTDLHNYLNLHDYINKGSLNVNAKYKGAHGENYPRNFVYNFELLNNEITFSNENGYTSLSYSDDIIDILKILKYLNVDDFSNINTTIDGNKIKVNVDDVNKTFRTNLKSMVISIDTKGFFIKEVVSKSIQIDNINIYIEDNEIIIDYLDNKITINKNEMGYSLNINNILKMNAFLNDEKNSYSIIINDYVFYLEYYDEKMVIKASSDAAIYNGIDIDVNFSEVVINKEEEDLKDNNPIIRYLDNVNLKYWR